MFDSLNGTVRLWRAVYEFLDVLEVMTPWFKGASCRQQDGLSHASLPGYEVAMFDVTICLEIKYLTVWVSKHSTLASRYSRHSL